MIRVLVLAGFVVVNRLNAEIVVFRTEISVGSRSPLPVDAETWCIAGESALPDYVLNTSWKAARWHGEPKTCQEVVAGESGSGQCGPPTDGTANLRRQLGEEGRSECDRTRQRNLGIWHGELVRLTVCGEGDAGVSDKDSRRSTA